MSGLEWVGWYPELILAVVAPAIILLEAKWRRPAGYLALISGVGALSVALGRWGLSGREWGAVFYGSVVGDGFTVMLTIILSTNLVWSTLLALGSGAKVGVKGWSFGLVVLATSGFLVAVGAQSLTVVVGGLSVGVFCLCFMGYKAGLANKSWFVGGLVLLPCAVGIGLIQGELGSSQYGALADHWVLDSAALGQAPRVGITLLLVGLAALAMAFPFHLWVPTGLGGIPAPLAAFWSVGSTTVGVGLLARLFISGCLPDGPQWAVFFWCGGLATAAAGNVLVFGQRNLNGLLACCGLVQGGYMLATIAAGVEGVIVFLVFAVVSSAALAAGYAAVCLWPQEGKELELADWCGLAWRQRGLGFVLCATMFSMAGLPLTAGFHSRFLHLNLALENGGLAMAVAWGLMAVLSAAVHLRVVGVLFSRRTDIRATTGVVLAEPLAAMALGTAIIVGAGLWPEALVEVARSAVAAGE